MNGAAFETGLTVVCDVKPGIDPRPLLARSWNRQWLDFVTFTAHKKFKIYLSENNTLGLGALKRLERENF